MKYTYKKRYNSKLISTFLVLIVLLFIASLSYIISKETFSERASSYGIYDGVNYRLTASGLLIIGKNGETQTFANNNRNRTSYPWYATNIKQVRFEGNVVGKGSFQSMFENQTELYSFDGRNFNTSSITDMSNMFSGCGNLAYLNLDTFDTSNVTNMTNMFNSTPKIRVIRLGANFSFKSNSSFSTGTWQKEDESISYTSYELTQNYDGNTMSGLYRNIEKKAYAILYSNGELVFQIGDTEDSTRGSVIGKYTDFETTKYTSSSSIPWYSNVSSITSVSIEDPIISKSLEYIFSNMSNINEINLKNLITSETQYFNSIFAGCNNLKEVNMENIDFSNYNQYSYAMMSISSGTFTNLITLNVSNSIMPKKMESFFGGMTNLKNLYLDNINTYNTTNIQSAFAGCKNIEELDLSDLDTRNCNSLLNIFSGMDSLKTLTLGTNTINYETTTTTIGISGVWQDEENEKKPLQVILNNYENEIGRYTKLEEAYAILYDSGDLVFQRNNTIDPTRGEVVATYTDFENKGNDNYWREKNNDYQIKVYILDEIVPYQTFGWFCNIISIEGIENLNTKNVVDMSSMFEGAKITSLDLGTFDTRNVEDMEFMFNDCKELKELDLSNFDTSKCKKMRWMFSHCDNLEELNLSSFNTSNVTAMDRMFRGSMKLKQLDLSNFDTSNVTDMYQMFEDCKGIENLDLSSFSINDTTCTIFLFNNCSSLKTLKLGTNWKFLPDEHTDLTKSWLRDGDTTIYTAEELTTNYNGSTMAGTYRVVSLLTITEQVKGSLANTNKNFNFTINVKDDGVGINSTHAYTGNKTGILEFNNGNAIFTLKHGESITVYLPIDNDYTITQVSDGYTLAKTNDTGTLDSDKTASFINTLNGTTPTGVFLNIIPYIIMLIIGTVGLLWIRSFKRI